MGGNDLNRSVDRSQSSIENSVSDRRLGMDWGKFGRSFLNCMAEKYSAFRVSVFCMQGARRSGSQPGLPKKDIVSFRGAALARSKLNTANFLLLLEINVQFSGVEMMQLRQYRHTWVSGIIDPASSSEFLGTSRAI